MPQKGIHPMMNLVRVVLSNGASVMMPMAWQRPLSQKDKIVTKFTEVDYLNVDRVGSSRRFKRQGQRAKFENKFQVQKPASMPNSRDGSPKPN